MNKVYKVVWNEVRQCYVVASELAKKQTKGCGMGRRMAGIVLAGAAGLSLLASSAVWAADTTPGAGIGVAIGTGSEATTSNHVAVGKDAKATGGNSAVAVGQGAKASSQNSIAIGYGSVTDGSTYDGSKGSISAPGANTIAIGYQTKATSVHSLAVGGGAEAAGTETVAIGQQAKATGNASTSVGVMSNGMAGESSGVQSVAMGYKSVSTGLASTAISSFSSASEVGATAVGYSSDATAKAASAFGIQSEASGVGSVAVGMNSKASRDGGVALGQYSIATVASGILGYDPLGTKHEDTDADIITWKANNAAVSIGGKYRHYSQTAEEGYTEDPSATDPNKKFYKDVTYTRQIVNVAAGTEDTDAVNVAQLKASATASKTHFYSVKSTDSTKGNYNNDGATGENALAAGVGAAADGDSSISVGTNAKVASNGHSLTSIAIGKNAYVLNGTGQQEYELSFDKANWTVTGGLFTKTYNPIDKSRVAGGIAIGTNSYARTGSVQIGSHTYTGTMGGAAVTDKTNGEANIVDMTTIGTNSYNKGAFATMMGAYSIATGDFDGSGGFNSFLYGSQNMGANVIGSLNQIRSKGYGGTSGVANSIVGIANVAENANGALIYGAGNKISNSIQTISGISTTSGASTVDKMVDSLRKAVQDEEGGATLAIGGGNTADYTQASQLIGVNNTLEGSSGSVSKYNMIDGYKNTAKNVQHVSVIGSENTVSDTKNALLFGDKRKLTGANNSIVLGASVNGTTTNVQNAVVIGLEANVTKQGGVALGANAVASIDKGVVGYDPATKAASTETSEVWESTAAAVSVGDSAKKITRQITNVAAGTEDTDAVNVAQLKALGEGVTTAVEAGKTHYYSVNDRNGQLSFAPNYNNDGAKGTASIVAGLGSSINVNNEPQAATASIFGTMNTINAKSDKQYDGVANSIVGTVNVTDNANASLIFGAGNIIKNSYGDLKDKDGNSFNLVEIAGIAQTGDTEALAKKLGEYVSSSGGAVLAIGGGNVADYATHSKVVGIGNTLTGEDGNESKLNMIDGFGNTGNKINNTTIIGSENTVSDTKNALLFGDKRTLTGANNSIVLGTSDNLETNVEDAVAIGHNANVSAAGGVALGSESIASTDKGVAGYDPSTKAASTDTSATWKSTAAAVSVGDAAADVTRQITGVAAGFEDTDAVNVAQLKKVEAAVQQVDGKHTTITAGTNVTVTDLNAGNPSAGHNYKIDVDLSSVPTSGKLTFKGDSGSGIDKNLGETLEIKGGAAELTDNNIGVVSEGGVLNVKLAKNITGVETLTVSEKITVGETTVGKDTVTTKTVETETVKAGDTTINTEGVSIQNGPSITKNNVDMHNQQIHNVQDGSAPADAATVGQVQKLQQETGKEISRIDNRVDRLDSRVDKVGAGAAALAALHPVDFDADDKIDVAAGWGHYKGQNAMALGAFYRPDERTMFSIGGAFGNGENLINAGVTFKLDKQPNGYHNITSKVQLAKEVTMLKTDNEALRKDNAELREQVKAINEKLEKLLAAR